MRNRLVGAATTIGSQQLGDLGAVDRHGFGSGEIVRGRGNFAEQFPDVECEVIAF